MTENKKSKSSTAAQTLTVKQVRSGIARNPQFRATLKSLGLGKVGKVSVLPANPAVIGMVEKVAAVVQVAVTK